MKTDENCIYVDTNVIIGAYLSENKDDIACLNYLYSLSGKKLYISTLSIAQFISTSQKKNKGDSSKTIKTLKKIISKFYILSFIEKDILDAISIKNFDIEDNIQYTIGRKANCYYYITNNIKDFNFINISVLNSKKHRKIIRS